MTLVSILKHNLRNLKGGKKCFIFMTYLYFTMFFLPFKCWKFPSIIFSFLRMCFSHSFRIGLLVRNHPFFFRWECLDFISFHARYLSEYSILCLQFSSFITSKMLHHFLLASMISHDEYVIQIVFPVELGCLFSLTVQPLFFNLNFLSAFHFCLLSLLLLRTLMTKMLNASL